MELKHADHPIVAQAMVIVVQAKPTVVLDVWRLLDVVVQLRLRMVPFPGDGREEPRGRKMRNGNEKWK